MHDGRVVQPNPPVAQPVETRRYSARFLEEDVKLGRSPGWNPWILPLLKGWALYRYESEPRVCEVGENVDTTAGRTKIKITLAGSLVYFLDIWIGDLAAQDAILGMDFMVPAGIRLDLADGSICLSDEIKIQLSGRRQLYSGNARHLEVRGHLKIDLGESAELPTRLRISDREKLWLTCGDRGEPTVTNMPGRTRYLKSTDISGQKLIPHRNERIGTWLAADQVPRLLGYVSNGSRRYMEWQNLAFQTTTDEGPGTHESLEATLVPAVERPKKLHDIGRRSRA
ncbi:hypothetical protein ON010_g17325 [Phytophthora cinnamomi]|nr:hypothetical protein ON010_g17325 [Phytophthora cinnamomi]